MYTQKCAFPHHIYYVVLLVVIYTHTHTYTPKTYMFKIEEKKSSTEHCWVIFAKLGWKKGEREKKGVNTSSFKARVFFLSF